MAVSDAQIKKFINLLGGLCVNECNRRIAAGEGFILPSVALAQSALETGWGTADIMDKANAFFGVKAGGSWTGKIFTANTWEVKENGEAYNTVANFRAYDSLAEGVADYYKIMTGLSRYANAVSYGKDSTKWLTAQQTISALHAGGYATDKLYVNKIMNTINGRDLTSVDKLIDGVTFLPNYSDMPDYFYEAKDLLKGGLEITDSGRTISYNKDMPRAYASDWANAPSIKAGYFLRPEKVDDKIFEVIEAFYIATIVGETVALTKVNDYSFNADKDYDKVGFYFTIREGADESDLAAYLPIILKSPAHIADGNEVQKSALAFFVKIE